MATVRETVYAMMKSYPSLFGTVSDCYRHLFLSGGNGYEWVDGKLVGFTLQNRDISQMGGSKLDKLRYECQLKLVEEHFDLFFEEPVVFRDISWLSEYAHIFNLPSDITDDWKDAAFVTCNVLKISLVEEKNNREMNDLDMISVLLEPVHEKLKREREGK